MNTKNDDKLLLKLFPQHGVLYDAFEVIDNSGMGEEEAIEVINNWISDKTLTLYFRIDVDRQMQVPELRRDRKVNGK